MGKYIFGLLAVVILALVALYAFDPAYQQQRETSAYYQAEAQRLQVAAQATSTALTLERQQTTAPVVTGLSIWSFILIGLAMGAAVVLGAMFCLRRLLLVRTDAQGKLPTPLLSGLFPDLATDARGALAAFHEAQITRADVQPVPTNYAPSVSYTHNPSPRITVTKPDADRFLDGSTLDSAPLLTGVPTFAQLLDQGRIGRGQPLLLGVDEEGQEVSGSWLDLYSTIVSGLPGSGKTTSQRFLAAQTALQGARFVIVDPHAGAADDSLAATLAPLSRAFLCEPASDDKAILSAVQLVADIGDRRVRGKDASTYPVILWLDETTKLLSRSSVAGALAELLEAIAQEYRKKNVFACASGQIWSASRTGDDSALRDSFASVLCHRMKRSQARLLIPTEEAQTVERLGTGQAVLWRTSGETSVISVPNTTAQDVVRVAGLLTDNAPTVERVARPASHQLLADLLTDEATARPRPSAGPAVDAPTAQTWPSHGPDAATVEDDAASASQSGIPASAEAARILALFRAGENVHAIVSKIYEQTNPGARAYKDARQQVESVLRAALGGTA